MVAQVQLSTSGVAFHQQTAVVRLVESVSAHEEKEREAKAAEDGGRLLRLGPRVRPDAVGLVVLKPGNLDLHWVKESLRRLAVDAGVALGQHLEWSQARDVAVALGHTVFVPACAADRVSSVLLHELLSSLQPGNFLLLLGHLIHLWEKENVWAWHETRIWQRSSGLLPGFRRLSDQ